MSMPNTHSYWQRAIPQRKSWLRPPPADASPWFYETISGTWNRLRTGTAAPCILDCSRWIEAPTGRHGFVTVKGDRFAFENRTPARLYGAQMNLFRKEQLDYAVRRMRRQGINITRLHGLRFFTTRDSKTSLEFSFLDYALLTAIVSHGNTRMIRGRSCKRRIRGGPRWASVAAFISVLEFTCGNAHGLTLVEGGKPQSILVLFEEAFKFQPDEGWPWASGRHRR